MNKQCIVCLKSLDTIQKRTCDECKEKHPWIDHFSKNTDFDIQINEKYRFFVHPSFPYKEELKYNFKQVKVVSKIERNAGTVFKVRLLENSGITFRCYAAALFNIKQGS